MNILLIGAPGSGKGTESELLCEQNGFTQLSTGDLFRSNIANKTQLGLEAKNFMEQGLYVPDNITNGMVKEYLKTKNSNLIFDGYPRTLDQAIELDKMLLEVNKKIDHVIYIDVNDSILLNRLTGRLVCEICKRSYHIVNRKPLNDGVCDFDYGKLITRPDDQEDKIKVRLQVYNDQTKPLIDFYLQQNKLIKVDGNNKTPKEFHTAILKELGL
ncbi:adenylate kinase [Spiroplasma gladiatoris]|uniref:Adenylate kinase n=1 Tax=Spiroplasma gladiatoris TaxID=2143 RepID=A0A4V1AQD5_9MOLU|nr:adenylate kinase [Spiroplasma gladiatoris]QBQ08119.1 adenylate kinase [Spiroplasma gladiatoris]